VDGIFMANESVVIVSGARTPMGGLRGSLKALTAVQLGTVAIREAVARAGIDAADIDEVIMGNVLSAGLRQGPARQAAIEAGIPKSTGAVTINKLCGSGMQAAMFAHDAIAAGTNKIMVAGGMESMSNAPHIVMHARSGVHTGHTSLYDHMFFDGLEDATTSRPMGSFAQETATRYGLTREQMDAYAIESLTRAQNAIKDGSLKAESVAVTIHHKKGDEVVSEDEQPMMARLEKIPTLKPAFAKDGTITPANASSISDGASALVLMSESEANKRGVKAMARIVAHTRHSQEPGEFTLAPIGAINKLYEKTGWSDKDVDLYEINEAFAMVTMLAMQELNIDHAKVNIHGGACAQGHPVGSTGSRLIVTLMYALKKLGKKRGIAALCIGGGEATAVAIEML